MANHHRRGRALSIMLLLASAQLARGDDEQPTPPALLKGVEAARMKHDRPQARVTLQNPKSKLNYYRLKPVGSRRIVATD